MTWTKIRSAIGALFAIGIIFIMFCAIAAKNGWQIPGVVQVEKALGFID